MALDQEKLNQFRIQKERLAGMLTEASGVIHDLNMTVASENLEKLGKKVNNETFKIQVVGTFSNGKSTVINAFLGENVLPAYHLPTTAVINEVKWGEKKEAILHFRNPLPEKMPDSLSEKAKAHMKAHGMKDVPPLHIDYSELEEYVVIPIGKDPKEMLLESPYEKVELFWPLDMLKEGVEIIDTPGLNEGETRTKVTMDYLTKADAILFVLIADRLCALDEMQFIENNLHEYGFTEPFFLVNHFDLIPDSQRESIKRFAKMKLDEYSTNDIFYISAFQALEGRVKGDDDLYEKSGMGEFTQRLTEYLTRDKGRIKLSQPARELKRMLNNEALYKAIPNQRAMLDSSLDEVKSRYDTAKPKLETLRSQKQQIVMKMQLRTEQSKNEFKRAVLQNTTALVNMIPGWISEYKPNHKLGIIPTKSKITAVVNEIVEYVTGKIEEQQKVWKNEVMMPLANDRAQFIFESAEKDLTKLYAEIDAVTIAVSGNKDVDVKPVPLWQRIAGAAAGTLLLMPDLAFAAGIHGLTKELLKNVAVIAGVEMLLIVLGLANPLVWIAGIIMAIIGGGLRADAALKKIKEDLSASIVNNISSNAQESSETIANSIASKMMEIVDDISLAVDNEIKQTEEQVNSIMEEMRKGQSNVNARKQVINACEAKIKALNTDLDALTFELIEQR